jgi:hypothetical protein
MLRLLDKRPMTFGDLRKKIKKGPKTTAQNLKIAKEENFIYQDGLKQYNLTSLGKIAIDYVGRRDNFARWQIETQEVDPIRLSRGPEATCTLITENAKRIIELDDKTASQKFNLEEPQNNTLIKSALARVVDSVLETIEKDMGLFTVRDGELAENSLDPNYGFQNYFPGYDYLKRYKNLANIDFKLQIEFNGKKWFKTQRLVDLERKIDDMRKSRKDYHKNFLSPSRRRRISDAISNLMQIREDYYKYAYLFKDRDEMKERLLEHFSSWSGEQNDSPEEIVTKAFKCGLFQPENKKFFRLKVNPGKYAAFVASLGYSDGSAAY